MDKEISFKTLPEFIDIVSTIPKVWKCHPNGIWYRGIENDKFSLVPGTVWRGVDFELENSMVSEFIIHYQSFFEKQIKIISNLELYILMQHYGLPTRLLDWTMSPLVALYFALKKKDNNDGKRVVWAMSCQDLNNITLGKATTIVPCSDKDCIIAKNLPSAINNNVKPEFSKYPIAFKHPLTNMRIRAQKGCFTFHGYDNRSINSYFDTMKCDYMIKIILADNELRHEILDKLYSIGFKEDDIFQDLNSLASRIIREHEHCFIPPSNG
ncbi:MAG: FRG domain-containing protein [Proteobacteria bacterium]|nr:FRG domain-containing protein [Pseudomonadota bacterium]MCG2756856.1 FRG domain-containing protein [Desulfobacteraceae bacterium]MCG2831281.1 FRG domain-containing protein [Desulfobacteraceae bacterium]